MRRKTMATLLVTLCTVPSIAFPAGRKETEAKTEQTIDTTYISKDFVAAVVVHPKQILEDRNVKQVLAEYQKLAGRSFMETAFRGIKQELGIDPKQVRQVVFLADSRLASFLAEIWFDTVMPRTNAQSPDPLPGDFEQRSQRPPNPSTIVRFAERVPKRLILKRLYRGGAPKIRKHAGKTYHVFPDDMLSFCFVDEKTLLVSDEEMLKKMITAKGVKSPLTKRLAALGTQHDVGVVFSSKPFIPLLGGIPRDKVPKEMGRLLDSAMRIETVVLNLQLSGKTMLAARAAMTDRKNAARLQTLINKPLLPVLKALYQRGRAVVLKELPDMKPLFGLFDELVAGVRVAQKGTEVVVSVSRPKQMDNLAVALRPAIKQVVVAQLRSERKINLKLIGLAMHNYHDTHARFPGNGSDGNGKKKGLSWRVHLLPFLEEAELYRKFKLDEVWDSPHNKKLIAKMPDVFKMPGVKIKGESKTAIHVFVGEKTPFGRKVGGIRIRDITDGTSNTILAVEAGPDKAEFWTKPGGLPFDSKQNPLKALGAMSGESGFEALFMDGSVKFMSRDIDTATLKRLIQHADGEGICGF